MLCPINLRVQFGALLIALLIFSAVINLSFPVRSDNTPKWTNATVPFLLLNTFTNEEISVIYGVFQEISHKTCVKFVHFSNERDFVQIQKVTGCYSALGRAGGFQVINLEGESGPNYRTNGEENCFVTHGLVAYRLMQTLGFYPEHLRPDRDAYVEIYWENIPTNKTYKFAKYPNALFNISALPYDYGSITHGKLDLFAASNDTMTIVPITKYGVSIGQKHGLSDGDIQKIRHVYCTANENLVNTMLLLLLTLFSITVNLNFLNKCI